MTGKKKETFVQMQRRKEEELLARFNDEDGIYDPARFTAWTQDLLRRWKAACRDGQKRVTPASRPKVSSPTRHVNPSVKHIYLVGVSCVGKTAIGAQLAKNLGIPFIDFDTELERRTGKSISRLKAPFFTEHSFRADVAAPILKSVIKENSGKRTVIELPPSGLMDAYWRVVKKNADAVIVAVCDRSANIIKRVTFYNDDSKIVEVRLTKKQERLYLKEIQKDVEYFGRTYKRADVRVDLAGASVKESAEMIQNAIATHLPLKPARSRNAKKR